jgi:uncharacterized protein (TIGR03435 family)
MRINRGFESGFRGSVALAVLLCGSFSAAHSQESQAKPPAYDVVAIKPNKSGSGNVSIDVNDDTYTASNVSLKMLLESAYDIKQDLISGLPGWANSGRFDVSAKIVDMDAETVKKLTSDQRRVMMQQLLAERFQMKVHKQTETLPVYEMVVAKGGAKIKEVPPVGPDPEADKNKTFNGSGRGNMSVRNTQLTAHDVPLSQLTYMLAYQLHRTVLDKTGLKGNYDLSLTWTRDDGTAPDADSAAPSLFTAVQEQLGLRLQASKGPVETLVVDHVEEPSEN